MTSSDCLSDYDALHGLAHGDEVDAAFGKCERLATDDSGVDVDDTIDAVDFDVLRLLCFNRYTTADGCHLAVGEVEV